MLREVMFMKRFIYSTSESVIVWRRYLFDLSVRLSHSCERDFSGNTEEIFASLTLASALDLRMN